MATVTIGCGPSASDALPGATEPATSSFGSTTVTTGTTDVPAPSDTEPTSDTTGDRPAPVPDVGPVPVPCDLFAQDCPDGHKCVPCSDDGGPAWNTTCCVDVVQDPAGLDEACELIGRPASGPDTCDFGLMCWDVQRDGMGECAAICGGSLRDPECPDDHDCASSGSGVIVLCLPLCHPLTLPCDDGEGCYPSNDAFSCAPDASGRTGGHGDPCQFINACDPDAFCIGADAHSACDDPLGCCAAVCDTSDPNADAMCAALDPGQSCESWYVQGMAPEGYDNVGVCALPPT